MASCQSEKLLYNNVTSLSLEPDHRADLNVGSVFFYTILAELKTGEVKKVKNDALISFPDSNLTDAGVHEALISQPMNSFEDSLVHFDIALELGDYCIQTSDTLTLNFNASIKADWRANNGKDGLQPRASAATLFSRDGLEGRAGGNGQDGQEGAHFTGYLWIHEKELRLLLICDSSDIAYCYRSTKRDSVVLDLSGSNAGDGGRGGKGGNGKPGKVGKPPGNGADGGPGGNGGKGGNGGSLVLFLHPSASYMNKSIRLVNSGGKGGAPGKGGNPGTTGKPLKGQQAGTTGKAGEAGTPGIDGTDGPEITISVVGFDIDAIKRLSEK